MIYSLRFKNFACFENEVFIDFKNNSNENFPSVCESESSMCFGSRINKVSTFIGANAAGKTNALKALAFLRWFICFSFSRLKPDELIPVDHFEFGSENDISEFEVIYETEDGVFKSFFSITKEKVLREELHLFNYKTKSWNYLFKRIFEDEKYTLRISQKFSFSFKKTDMSINRKNISFISLGVAFDNGLMKNVYRFWEGVLSNVIRSGKRDRVGASEFGTILEVTKSYKEDPELFNQAINFLKEMDLGLERIEIEKRVVIDEEKGEEKEQYFPVGIHKVKGEDYKLAFIFESQGTRKMYIFLKNLFNVLLSGGIALIDEMDTDIHPEALIKIIKLFIDKDTNPHNAQLLFSAHSFEPLAHLEKEQIFLVEKNRDCQSELYRLDEIQGVRRNDNYYAKYLAGAYGGLPRI